MRAIDIEEMRQAITNYQTELLLVLWQDIVQ